MVYSRFLESLFLALTCSNVIAAFFVSIAPPLSLYDNFLCALNILFAALNAYHYLDMKFNAVRR